jgi:hypothetical protein
VAPTQHQAWCWPGLQGYIQAWARLESGWSQGQGFLTVGKPSLGRGFWLSGGDMDIAAMSTPEITWG